MESQFHFLPSTLREVIENNFRFGLSAIELILNEQPSLINQNDKNYFDFTPLAHSIRTQNLEVLKLLIKKGANVNLAFGTSKTTPLHYACTQDDIDIIKLLLQNNAAIDQKDLVGWTPLFYSCDMRQTKAIQFLLKNRASTKIEDLNGNTPFVIACKNDVVTQFFKSGFFPTLKELKKRKEVLEPDTPLFRKLENIEKFFLLMYSRLKDPESVFFKDYLPLDIFKIICSISEIGYYKISH